MESESVSIRYLFVRREKDAAMGMMKAVYEKSVEAFPRLVADTRNQKGEGRIDKKLCDVEFVKYGCELERILGRMEGYIEELNFIYQGEAY